MSRRKIRPSHCLLAAFCMGVLASAAGAGEASPSALVKEGRELFLHRWEPNDRLAQFDGLGPVFNERSCVACHGVGGVGGAGGLEHNIQNFEVMATRRNPAAKGTVHRSSVTPEARESAEAVQKEFPIVRGGLIVSTSRGPSSKAIDPVRMFSVNSTSLFGIALIDRIGVDVILSKKRPESSKVAGVPIPINYSGVRLGKASLLPDGRVGRLGWKAQGASMKSFVAAACANELGLGTPISVQATPLVAGGQMSAQKDAEPEPDLTDRQLDAMAAYVASLPRPERFVPAKPSDQRFVNRGAELFNTIGCAACHTPDMGEVSGIYSDLRLYDLTDEQVLPFAEVAKGAARERPRAAAAQSGALPSVTVSSDGAMPPAPTAPTAPITPAAAPSGRRPGGYYGGSGGSGGNIAVAEPAAEGPTFATLRQPMREDQVMPDEWRTPPLWGVADSAPYLHDGSAPTLAAAIAKHGGAARGVRERFNQLGPERENVIAFLMMLRAPRDAEPAPVVKKETRAAR